MEALIVILILAAFVGWILAELRGGRLARFVAGAAVVAAAYFVGQFVASVIPSYERSATRASMRRLAELFSSGQTDRARSAIDTYNATAEQGSTYKAALKMWDAVSPKAGEAKQR